MGVGGKGDGEREREKEGSIVALDDVAHTASPHWSQRDGQDELRLLLVLDERDEKPL